MTPPPPVLAVLPTGASIVVRQGSWGGDRRWRFFDVYVCYHLANGLATGAMAWGITVTRAAQRRWNLCCLAIGVALAAAGTAAWAAFAFGLPRGW